MSFPHLICWNGDPVLTVLGIVANIEIAVAYFVIPFGLWRLVRKKRIGATLGLWIFGLFGAFILLCGMTHVLDIAVVFKPWFIAQVVILHLTGIVSLYTALVFAPRAIKLLSQNGSMYEAHRLIEQMRDSDPDYGRMFDYLDRRGTSA